MIKISKDVALKLNAEYGVPYRENGISKTHSKHPTYFLCESEYNITSLLKITTNDKAEKLLIEMNKRKNRKN